MERVFLALGGNVGDVRLTFESVCAHIKAANWASHFQVSKIYRTLPLSDLPQDDFLNCVIGFETTLTLDDLWNKIQEIEKKHGKVPKAKNAPRMIDIDIIAYGEGVYGEGMYAKGALEVPHPHWKERFFVLLPLLDLVPSLLGVNLQQQLEKIQRENKEVV